MTLVLRNRDVLGALRKELLLMLKGIGVALEILPVVL